MKIQAVNKAALIQHSCCLYLILIENMSDKKLLMAMAFSANGLLVVDEEKRQRK